MATFDHPSDLVHLVAHPSLERPRLQIDWRDMKEEKQPPLPSNLQENEIGDIFYFVDSRPRNPWAAIGSLLFLSLLLLALIIVPLLHTDPLPRRERLTQLYLQPPAAAGTSRIQAPKPIQVPKPKSTYAPTSIALPAPMQKTPEAPPASVDTAGAVIGGVPGGLPGGVLSGAADIERGLPLLAKTPEPTPVKRVRVASRVAEANLIHDVAPQYPPEAGQARIEGTVVLMAVIGKDGSVLDVHVETGLPLLARAAVEAVKQWRYKPYLLNGEPVEINSQITINFTLSKG